MSRTRLLAAALFVAAFVAAALADDTPGERYYKLRFPKVEKTAALRIWETVDRARAASLFRFAREAARRVLDLDPDNAKARAFLGYKREGEVWEFDLTQSGKLPTDNVQAPTGPRLADAEPAWRALAAKADLDVAAIFAAFGDECAGHGFHAESRAAYERALALDPDNSSAHRGLDHVKLADGLWISAAAARALEAARVVRVVVAESRWDEMFGVPLNKAETAHFRIESPFDQKRIASYLDGCERVYAAYLADFGLAPDDDVFAKPPLYCVLETDAQWDKWVSRVVQPGRMGFFRALTCHLARDRGACALRNFEKETEDQRRDRLMHETGHFLNYALWDVPDGCWVDEAIAYRYPLLLQGTSYSFCIGPRKDQYGKGDADRSWSDPSQWRSMLKDMVEKHDDAELRLVVGKSAYELPIVCSIKAWSVVDYLLRRDRAAFIGMLGELKGVTDPRQYVTFLETRFGKSVETIDADWRKWVLANY